MWKVMQFVSIVGIFVLCVAELPHLSIEEFRKQETGRHKGQYGGIRGGIVTAETSIGVTTSASLMLSSLDLEPGLEQTMKQQQRCVDPYRNVPVYGWRWFQKFGNDLNDALNCWGISEMRAKMRDSNFESRRSHCVRRALGSQGFINSQQQVSASHLDDILCHALTESIRSKDPRIQFARRVKLCVRERLDQLQPNTTINLEDVRVECMQKHKSVSMKPTIRDEDLNDEFSNGHEMYVQAIRTADSLLSEMNHCLRYFSLVGKEANEYEKLEKVCRNQSQSDNTDRHLPNEYQVDICIFSNSTKGRVAREDISVQYSCLNQLLASPSSTEESKTILLDLFWNQTQPLFMEDQITCKALSGRPRWIKTAGGWKLTCERLRTLKAKRQAEIEDLPMEESNQTTVPTEIEGDFARETPTDSPEAEESTETTKASTETSPSPDRFQILEQLNQCILAKLRTSSARAALKELEKVHREWQQKHTTCWNKFKGDEERFSMKKKMQPYRVGFAHVSPARN